MTDNTPDYNDNLAFDPAVKEKITVEKDVYNSVLRNSMAKTAEVETLRELLHECQKHIAAVALMLQNVNKWNQVMYYKLQEVLKDGKD